MSLQRLDGSALPASVTCFLVEDSTVIRDNLSSALEEMLGLQMLGSAADEGSAVHWMQTAPHRCDIMIIDLFLKAGTGLNVLVRARTLRPSTKLVVLTNYATKEMRQRCLQLGADRVFDKSAELEQLLSYCETVTLPR